jgi:hypothetical protein
MTQKEAGQITTGIPIPFTPTSRIISHYISII